MNSNIKYIHLLWGHDLKFSGPMLVMFNDKNGSFDISNQLFVTPYENVYDELKKYKNVILDKSNVNLYKKYYSPNCWIVSHGYKSVTDFFKIKKKILKRIIFRTWGGSVFYKYRKDKSFLYNMKRKIFYFFYRRRIVNLAAIGVANYVDEFEIKKLGKKIPLHRLSYTDCTRYNYVTNLKKSVKNNKVLNVLIGHRGSKDNNHLEIVEMLRNFKDNINIFIPLSYGDDDYIKMLSFVLENEYTDFQLHIIRDFYQFEEYSEFLSKMDIAIFDGKDSYALGNIELLLMLGKKIYLSKDSLIAKVFEEKKVPHGIIESIQDLDFNSFSQKVTYERSSIEPFIMNSYEGAVNNWHQLFIDFK